MRAYVGITTTRYFLATLPLLSSRTGKATFFDAMKAETFSRLSMKSSARIASVSLVGGSECILLMTGTDSLHWGHQEAQKTRSPGYFPMNGRRDTCLPLASGRGKSTP